MMKKHPQVKWSDNSRDYNRECIMCTSLTCVHPVHPEFYKEIYLSRTAKQWDLDNPVIGSLVYDPNCSCHKRVFK